MSDPLSLMNAVVCPCTISKLLGTFLSHSKLLSNGAWVSTSEYDITNFDVSQIGCHREVVSAPAIIELTFLFYKARTTASTSRFWFEKYVNKVSFFGKIIENF